MSILEKLKARTIEAAANYKDALLASILRIRISEDQINQAIERVIAQSQEVQALSITLGVDQFNVTARAKGLRGYVTFNGSFRIARFVVNPDLQQIQLKSCGTQSWRADSWFANLLLKFTVTVFSLCGKSMLQAVTRNMSYVSYQQDLILIELASLGIVAELESAIREKAGQFGEVIGTLFRAGVDHTSSKIELKGVECVPGNMILLLRGSTTSPKG